MDIASAARLLLLAAIWGGSFLFMRIGAPVFGADQHAEQQKRDTTQKQKNNNRKHQHRKHKHTHWRHYLVIGLLNSALPFLMCAGAARAGGAARRAGRGAAAPGV